MAKKKLTAAQQARKLRKRERRKDAIANRPSPPSPEQRREEVTRKFNAEKWHSTAAHEIGHAVITTLLGLPIKEVSCRKFGDNKGTFRPALERRAYTARAIELPPASHLCQMAAGAAGTRVAGFSVREADRGTESDRDLARATTLLAAGKVRADADLNVRVTEINLARSTPIPYWQRAYGIAEQVLRKEKKAFSMLVEELRYSPRGRMRGGRVAEVLFSHGVDVSGTREFLLAEAKKLNKDIGAKAGLGFQGMSAKQWEQRSRQIREHRNAADRARRAKKRSVR
jgi:hypothetical protein